MVLYLFLLVLFCCVLGTIPGSKQGLFLVCCSELTFQWCSRDNIVLGVEPGPPMYKTCAQSLNCLLGCCISALSFVWSTLFACTTAESLDLLLSSTVQFLYSSQSNTVKVKFHHFEVKPRTVSGISGSLSAPSLFLWPFLSSPPCLTSFEDTHPCSFSRSVPGMVSFLLTDLVFK